MGRSQRLHWAWTVILAGLIGCSAGGAPSDPVADGQRAFTLYCAGCHSLDANGPTALGPTMVGVASRAAANPDGLTVREWLTREIVDPNAVIADGYSAGLMPTTYRTDLSPEQYQSLIVFLETLR